MSQHQTCRDGVMVMRMKGTSKSHSGLHMHYLSHSTQANWANSLPTAAASSAGLVERLAELTGIFASAWAVDFPPGSPCVGVGSTPKGSKNIYKCWVCTGNIAGPALGNEMNSLVLKGLKSQWPVNSIKLFLFLLLCVKDMRASQTLDHLSPHPGRASQGEEVRGFYSL